MEYPTPEQLKAEKAERDSVLAELLINERKNKDLVEENNRLEKNIPNLRQDENELIRRIDERKKLLGDVVQIQKNIVNLSTQEKLLRESILKAEESIGLQSWVAQRDQLLKSIADLKTEIESLEKKNRELSESNSDIESRISKAQGRMEEMDKSEEAYKEVVGIEVSDLLSQKSKLEVEVSREQVVLESLNSKKQTLLEAIDTLTQIYDKVFSNVHEMEGIVGNVKEVSDKNIAELHGMFSEIGTKLTEVMEKGKESADGANVILEKLPRWIFELQRPVSLKRVRPERLVDKRLPEETNE
jgi:DNA repair exonuclease SbcCD ATPase subunit